ncbi:hypothetical protein N8137_05710, partial [Porticoccaceae bacterium]|nr:hypothetical protein [Porticoccaceae bacterium]
ANGRRDLPDLPRQRHGDIDDPINFPGSIDVPRALPIRPCGGVRIKPLTITDTRHHISPRAVPWTLFLITAKGCLPTCPRTQQPTDILDTGEHGRHPRH